MAELDPLFYPKSIAVIGASNRPLTIGHRIVENLLGNGFTGKVYPVNPKAVPVCEQKAYPSIKEVPGPVDLAHVIVKNSMVPEVLEDCADKGVKVCIINTSGFKEMGGEGVKAEEELVALARRRGLRLFGPNCQGVMNTDSRVKLYSNFTFARMTPGHISMVCQGGGVAEVINNYFGMHGLGQRMYASNGNACDISIPEILEYYGDDEGTRVIVLHVESFPNPREFLERVAPVAAKKPILALKSGITEEGARAVSSHTGGMMAGDTATDVLFDKCGILRFTSLAELCETAEAFACQPVPRGNRVGMVTNAGSPAIIVTDEAVQAGLKVPDLAPSSKAMLADKLQAIASIANPIDMMATAAGPEFDASLQALVEDPGLDSIVICFMTPFFVDTSGIAESVAKWAAKSDKTFIAVAMTDPEGKAEWRDTIARVRAAGLPVYYFPSSAARVLFHMDRYRRLRDRPREALPTFAVDREAARRALAAGASWVGGFLPPEHVSALLGAYGLPLAREARATTWDEVLAAAKEVGYPVALKAEAPDLVHKTEHGGVALDLGDETALKSAHDGIKARMKDREGLRFLVQAMVKGGVEVILGGAAAPGLGSTVMFGLGGVLVELWKDVVFKLAPLSRPEAEAMLDGIHGKPLLEGFRGQPPADRERLVDLLLRVSRLLADHPEIAELDLNPIRVSPVGGVTAVVDARVRVAHKA
ncbi:MAG: acetate--CoA ligase family protein [Polyangia bacterium]|jgi:acetyltransferase|nr:acetate--CoA ligase family protein [Polyangia bacterium]